MKSIRSIDNRLKKLEQTRLRSPTISRKVFEELELMMEKYNTSEMKTRRNEKYLEIQRIGQQRRLAYMRGEDMEKYTLPWQRQEKQMRIKELVDKYKI